VLERLRDHLARHVFREAPPAARLSRDRLLLYAGVAALAVAVQMLRMWSLHPLERLFSEDGLVYLADAQGDDPLSALTTPYNGYLQVPSRLIAEAVAELPVGWYAAAMAVSGALIVAGCGFVVWRAAAGLIEDRWLRAALGASVVLIGVVGIEMLANVVNTIWFIAFACFWLLLWRPRSNAGALLAGGFLLFGVLSTTATFFLAPLWLLRLLVARDRRDLAILAGFAIGAAIQLGLSWDQFGLTGDNGQAVTAGAQPGQPLSTEPFWDWELVPAYLQRVVGGAITGQPIDAWLWEGLGWPLLIVFGSALVGLVVWAVRTPATRLLVPLLVAISIALFLFSGYLRWGAGGFELFWSAGSSNDLSARYILLPALLLLSAAAIQLDAAIRAAPRGSALRAPRLTAAVVAGIGLMALVSFHVEPVFEGGPTWGEAVDDARATCDAGQADTVDVVANSTPLGEQTMPLSCAKLE
jgi:hypothetical protein